MKFEDFSLSKETLKSISIMGYEEPTPIQVSAIPMVMRGADLVGQAQTGTGKTAAFGIPIVELHKKGKKNPVAIILEPTRELAVQVAQEMLDMGFIEDIESILKTTPPERQTLLFSATMPQPIMNIAKRYMRNPEKIRINTKDLVVTEIKQVFYEVRDADKINALSRLIDVEDPKLAIVFCHTKRDVDDVAMKLEQMGYNASALHGDYTQARRDEVMGKFKKGMIDILVATDVAARGLDIKNVTHVINYSIPQNPDSYIHRIGRTGRAGKSGIAITLVTPREYNHLRLIERTAKTTIDRKKLPSSQEVIKAKEKNITKDISEIISANKHAAYSTFIKDLSEQFSFADIAAAAFHMAFGEPREQPIAETREREKTSGGVARLFMTIGRKDKVKGPD